jgi:hypothetical protein
MDLSNLKLNLKTKHSLIIHYLLDLFHSLFLEFHLMKVKYHLILRNFKDHGER